MDTSSALAGLRVATADEEHPEAHNKVWYLEQSPLCQNLTAEAMSDVSDVFVMREFPRKTLLFDLGDVERTIFAVKRGRIRIVRLTPEGKEVTIALLGPGAIFGEEALFGAVQRTTFAVVAEDALLCLGKAERLFALLERDATLATNVAGMLQTRLQTAGETIEDLSFSRLADRIMNLLQRLAAEYGVAVRDGIAFQLRLTHAEIASMVGSTRESVSAEIALLARQGRIHVSGGMCVVPQSGMP